MNEKRKKKEGKKKENTIIKMQNEKYLRQGCKYHSAECLHGMYKWSLSTKLNDQRSHRHNLLCSPSY